MWFAHQVFAINDRTGSRRNLQPPPQYMLDLYDSVADQSGIIKSAQPYNSTIVRSYTAKGNQQLIIYFIPLNYSYHLHEGNHLLHCM